MASFSHADLLRAKEYNGQPVSFIQEKMDGMRVLITTFNGRLLVVTREGKTDYTQEFKELFGLRVSTIPWDTAVDCELYAPGVQATDVKTLIIKRDTRLALTAFALPYFGGQDMRKGLTIEVINECLSTLGFMVPRTHSWEGQRRLDETDLLTWKAEATKRGIEGWVAKQAHYSGWYKIKPVRTCDCVVTGYTKSTSLTHMGGLKAIQVSLFDKQGKLIEVASVGSGFKADFRQGNLDILIGKVCEVSYDSLAAKGKLKFPRFVQWRDDKIAGECTMDQLEGR